MEGIVVTDPVLAVEKPEITSAVTTWPGPAEPTASVGSDGGDGSAASCPWSLTHEQQVHNLKENWKRALVWTRERGGFDSNFEADPWFGRVVSKLRVDPCFDSCELEIDQSLLGRYLPGARMNSLDLAILMGDPKMVQRILEKSSDADNVIGEPIQDSSTILKFFQHSPNFDDSTETGILYTPLHLAVEGGDSFIVDALLEQGADVNALNWSSQTPLDLACKEGNLAMLQQLLKKDVERKDPFHVAVRGGDVEFLKGLPSLNVNAVDHEKRTPLHLAVVGGNSHIVDALLEKGADIIAPDFWGGTPLNSACIKNVDMVLQLLAKDVVRRDPLDVTVQSGDVNFIKKLPSLNVNAVDHKGKTPLHYLATKKFPSSFSITGFVHSLVLNQAIDMKALDHRGLSAFYVAVLYCNTQFVTALLDAFKDKIRWNEVCNKDLGPPIQIAFEGGDDFKDIQRALMECDPVKGYMETLYRDRQVYVDAANAILVGAALIASVTFASWLQPPLNYTSYSTSNLNYVDVEHNIALRAFWVFNALSFYSAIATVVSGARSVLPRSHLFIKKTVEKLRTNLLMTSILLACSVLFVIIAFAIAGTIVLTPQIKYQWYMIIPTLVGGCVCIINLGFLVKSMVENSFNTRGDSKRLNKRMKDYLEDSG